MKVDALCYTILKEPHALIAGVTGSGKSTLLNSVLYTAQQLNLAYAIIDLKLVSLLPWESGAIDYATTPENALKLIEMVSNEMGARLVTMREKRIDTTTAAPIYLIIDEAADLLDTVKGSYDKLKHIARLGRAAGVHLILSTQSPSRAVIPASLTLNLTCRVGLHCENAIESRQIIGRAGCEMLPRYGEAILKTPAGVQIVKVNKLV